jgi:hypothetical protein
MAGADLIPALVRLLAAWPGAAVADSRSLEYCRAVGYWGMAE